MLIRTLLGRILGSGPSRAAVPAGRRVYAVGDIHGRADLLGRLMDQVDADLRERPVASASIILLGDYVDRGPSSAEVVERLARGDLPAPSIALRGNHDDLFLQVMRGDLGLGEYRGVGGDATLASYGLAPSDLRRLSRQERLGRLREAVPSHHLAFLEQTPFSHTVGDYFFCHAGARPGLALDAQAPEDLMWIREEFLLSSYDFGRVVVHGHTPVRAPQQRSNGIDIDTKAFASGRLTAVALEGTARRFLQT